MKTRIASAVAAVALVVGLGGAPAQAAPAAPVAPTSVSQIVVVPQATFCQVVGWWYWCRTMPQTKKCFLWKCW